MQSILCYEHGIILVNYIELLRNTNLQIHISVTYISNVDLMISADISWQQKN